MGLATAERHHPCKLWESHTVANTVIIQHVMPCLDGSRRCIYCSAFGGDMESAEGVSLDLPSVSLVSGTLPPAFFSLPELKLL